MDSNTTASDGQAPVSDKANQTKQNKQHKQTKKPQTKQNQPISEVKRKEQ